VRHGGQALRERAGLAGCCYLVQLGLSFAAAWAASRCLIAGFGGGTLLERVADGEVVATILALRHQPAVFAAVLTLAAAAALLYLVVSWFLLGGLVSTLLQPPDNRAGTVRQFGAGAATMFFSYCRLAIAALVPYALALMTLLVGVEVPLARALHVTSAADLAVPLLLGTAPGLLLALLTRTALDYARIDLARQRLAGTGGRSALGALARSYRLVLTRPRTLLHVLLYYAIVATLTAVYVAQISVSGLQPLLGASGAVLLFLLRQLLTLSRHAAAFTLLAGQVELARRLRPGA
jgi:hypothetical protein